MPRQKIILITGVVLAVMAAFMVKVYLDRERQTLVAQAKQAVSQIQANQTAVLVAKEDIPKGVVIKPEMLRTEIVPNQYVQPQAVTSLDRIAGMKVITPIVKGEQINLSKLLRKEVVERGSSLAMSTPIGKRAITVSVDNISSLVGMINPGNYVDVLAVLPVPVQSAEGKQAVQPAVVPLFQNILVLAVGQDTAAEEEVVADSRYKKEEKKTKEISSFITLALSPQEANLIAFVQEQGKIRLVLRSPADSQIEPIYPAGWDSLFQYIMPQTGQREIGTQQEEPQGQKVEIYRGLNKETVPLNK